MSIRCMGCMEEYAERFQVCPHCGYIRGTAADMACHMEPGSILHGRYIVGRVLGFGGFGVTYLGFDAVLQSKVAIKEYLPGEFSTRMPAQQTVTVYSGDREEQFNAGKLKVLDEARRLAQFQNSRYIVHIFDCFEENGTAYIIMEYCEGETLKARLDREGKIPPEEAVALVHEVIAGMKEVHAVGILHRDLAPDNIFLLKGGGIRILDFGAARSATTAYSKSLSVIVKDGFAPEEQYRSNGDQGTWTDVYALAATLYRMLTGVKPQSAMERGEKDLLERPSKLGAKIPKSMETALMNALNVRHEDRTRTMEEFETELSAAEVREKEAHKRKQDSGRVALPVRIGAAAAALLVAACSITLAVRRRGPGEYRQEKGMTTVPNFINLSLEDAEKAGKESRLVATTDSFRYSATIPAGLVLTQSPGSGMEVKERTEILMTVSRGRETHLMPKLTGLQEDDARKQLEEMKISVEVKKVSVRGWQEGAVVSQSIESGTSVKEGTTVTLEVCELSEADKASETYGFADLNPVKVTVPDLSGKTEEEARELVSDLGLILVPQYENSSTVEKGIILRVEESAGSEADAGTELHVTVSDGPLMKQIPAGIRAEQTADQARQTLEAEGFRVETRQSRSYSSIREGYVESVSPGEGEAAEEGSLVVLTISIGPEPIPETTRANRTTEAPRPVTQAPAEAYIPPETQPVYTEPQTETWTEPPTEAYTEPETQPVYTQPATEAWTEAATEPATEAQTYYHTSKTYKSKDQRQRDESRAREEAATAEQTEDPLDQIRQEIREQEAMETMNYDDDDDDDD